MVSDCAYVSNQAPSDFPPDSVLFGKSEVMRELRSKLIRVCQTTVPVLLQGEVGVGKSTLARFIHNNSAGSLGPYVSINCAALGGASTVKDSFLPLQGALGIVHGCCGEKPTPLRVGTLFLNQVSELTPELQQQLARSLAESDECAATDRRGGGEHLRIVCSSTRNVRREVRLGQFRRDLFYRVVVVAIDVPPLRNHLEDLPAIAEHLRLRHSAQLEVDDRPFSHKLLARMVAYRWPGNIRELDTFVCRYLVLGGVHGASV